MLLFLQCRNIQGLILKKKISANDIIDDQAVVNYSC